MVRMNAASFPISAPCPGCIDGTCANGMGLVYPPYSSMPDQLVMQCMPVEPLPAPEYITYGYGAPVYYFGHPSPHYPQAYQFHEPRNQGYRQDNGKRGSFKTRGRKITPSHVHPVAVTSEMESAIVAIKTNPQVTLFSIHDFIAEVATVDDGACRFVQDRIRLGSEKEQRLGLQAALASFGMLWRDYRGNRVLQALLTCGSRDMKKELMAAIHREGPLNLSVHKSGCRVIQTAITNIEHDDLIELASKFQGHTLSLIHDPNGNHVIQRMIEAISEHAKSSEAQGEDESASSLTAQLQFIIDDVIEHVESLSVHAYGCRVVQRALEFCNENQKNAVIKGVIKCKDKLMKDQYGNYVIQQAIVTGDEDTRDVILDCILNGSGPDSLLLLSKHKYASNVVEKFIQMGSAQHREVIIKESLRPRSNSDVCFAVDMAKDNIANYVIKTAIDCARADQKKQILDELSRNLIELSKYPQATYIFSKESGSVASA